MTVLDLNDNVPQLQLPALSFTVTENTSAPIIVTTAVATDRDIGTYYSSVYNSQVFHVLRMSVACNLATNMHMFHVHIICYSCSSPPSGANAAIVYRFTTTNVYFTINETTGVVATDIVLDREDIQEHELTIQVHFMIHCRII